MVTTIRLRKAKEIVLYTLNVAMTCFTQDRSKVKKAPPDRLFDTSIFSSMLHHI
jgi:hypothetical protein